MHDLLKALSLFAPLGFLPYLYEPDWTKNSVKLTSILIITIVLVNSFAYHTMCFLGKFQDIINNDARRLDQTGQHVANAVAAYILSGSTLYFALFAVYSTWCIMMLWRPTDPPWQRQINLLLSMVLSLAPMAWRGDNENLVGAVLTLGGMVVLFKLDGYCHALSHLLLVPYFYFVFKSASKVV
jgi:hypothetical protein